MNNITREQLNAYRQCVAEANGITFADTSTKFTVEPSIQQKLETKVQESSEFLSKINIVPVDEMSGELLGLGIAGTLASTTDTSTSKTGRETQDLTNMDSRQYHCKQINYDTHITYGQLDLWAKFPDFKKRIADLKTKRIALDRIMIGFNGTSHSKTSNRTTNPLLQDVQKGWLQQIRDDAPERHFKEETQGTSVIKVGKGQTYQNLDAVVYSAVNDFIATWHQEDTELVAIMGRDLLADKYFPLVNDIEQPTERMAADIIISQKRVGGLQAVRVPSFPKNTILITRLDNLSIYYQNGKNRRAIIDNVKFDRIEDYMSSNDAFVVENLDCVALIENLVFEDKPKTEPTESVGG
ncbi:MULTISPECIES: phage major capsid protein, P2 family [Pasteurellaceae]|uniref:Phage major capsid protein, P2 family n=1 Tax=Pasteurella atlantica TaxID=2827233 RepID=A0AAW8CS95_9PAST|nr:phage major capsid protein, P2 family [Pasteurella atlantica]MBR0573339.1 phage major capsid protein, P2 family [Pasteurella atlantica]MDP8040479.1 phage major capsid protein, P2 family [Pasteurella atlantica]MDP8041870.1 phage major capsid protein, P2 family [Pasteurella atlantica]MDP8043937.1 phage major capsid protein, P2 family [Pasteurella atlantica]MDP8046784.1 phage major capsid protein, P2 family [Pasteurella atlantica]